MTTAHRRPETAPAPIAPPLRVAICSTGEIWGGVEQFIVTLAEGLLQRGLTPRTILFHEGRLSNLLRERNVPIDVVLSSGPHDPSQIAGVRTLLRTHAINVVHTHGYKATIVAAAARVGLSQVRVMKTEHGRLEGPSTIRQVPGYLRLAANVALDTIVSRIAVDQMVYVSHDIKTFRGSWCGEGPVIHNGIVPDFNVPPRRAPGARAGFTLGIVGRLTAVKGHAHLFHALTQLPGSVRLKVFGTGPEDASLRALAARLGIVDRVDFEGFVSPIHPHLAALDLLVIPSLHEGLPYTLLEAMALRVPVVASNVGGLVEAIEDGVSGVLVPPKDPRAIAAAVRALQVAPEHAQQLAERAHVRLEEEFHADRMVTRYLHEYGQLLA